MRKLLAACSFVLFASISPSYATPANTITQQVGVCDPNNPTHCVAPDASGNMPVTGTFSASLGGFTPSASGARGTPVTVLTSDSSGTLPTGAVVAVTNVGANPMYCNVNGVAATTSDQYISSSGGWFAFTIPAAITTLHCIATGSSTTANMVGGSGLPTGTGGGGGSGGGGAVTVADGSDVAEGAKADAAWVSGSGSVVALLKNIAGGVAGSIPIGTNSIGTVQPGNTANTTPWLFNTAQINGVAPLMGNGQTGTGAQRVTLSQDGLSQPINVSTATDTQIVPLSGSTVIYVTSFDVVAGGTGNITFEYGTGSNCATGKTALTGAYPLTAQAGIAKGSGVGTILKVPAGNALCVLTSAAVQMSGSVSYIQF
jgi:hypothetical protein